MNITLVFREGKISNNSNPVPSPKIISRKRISGVCILRSFAPETTLSAVPMIVRSGQCVCMSDLRTCKASWLSSIRMAVARQLEIGLVRYH
jgi:hypothetical protein